MGDIFYQFNEDTDLPDEGGVKFPISFELDMWRYDAGSRTLFLPPGVFYYRQYFVPSKVKFSIFVVNKDTPLDVASLRNIFEFKRIGVGSDVSGASTTWSYTIGGNAGFSGKELNFGASAQISWTTSYSKGVKGQPDTKNEYEFNDAFHYEIHDNTIDNNGLN